MENQKQCPACRSVIDASSAFCPRCGKDLRAASAPAGKTKRKKSRGCGCLVFLMIIVAVIVMIAAVSDWDATISDGPTRPEFTFPTVGQVEPTVTYPTLPTTQPVTQPPTEPETVPTEPPTEPPVVYNPVPEAYRSNPYTESIGDGSCETMSGTMLVYVIFLDDSISSWDQAAMTKVETQLNGDILLLEKDAKSFGTDLDVSITYSSAAIDIPFDREDKDNAWLYAATESAGIASAVKKPTQLEIAFDVDNVPVVFVLNQEGRAFARSSSVGKGFEYAVIYGSEPTAFRHELLHLFGAKDFYFPQETVAAVNKYLPGSIMMESATGIIDSLTAFLIGWTETLDANAEAFLQATNHYDEAYLDAENEKNMMTGFGTKIYPDGSAYTGDLVFGVPNGQGTMQWADGNQYTGDWVNGERTGHGKYIGTDGFTYEGDWVDSRIEGSGTAGYSDGGSYTGDWVNGYRHGQGTYTFPDGTTYTGEWVDGERTGFGKYVTKDGFRYEGNWKNGLFHGKGTAHYDDGATYSGSWKDGDRHGKGTYTFADGSVYTGDWVAGNREGQGTLTWSNGSQYSGSWKQDKRSGQGTMTWKDGSWYKGDWKDNKQHGKGEYYYASYGTRYVGEFENGKRHGWGTYYYANGTTYEGPWENDARAD